jgi:hypothetical protein
MPAVGMSAEPVEAPFDKLRAQSLAAVSIGAEMAMGWGIRE